MRVEGRVCSICTGDGVCCVNIGGAAPNDDGCICPAYVAPTVAEVGITTNWRRICGGGAPDAATPPTRRTTTTCGDTGPRGLDAGATCTPPALTRDDPNGCASALTGDCCAGFAMTCGVSGAAVSVVLAVAMAEPAPAAPRPLPGIAEPMLLFNKPDPQNAEPVVEGHPAVLAEPAASVGGAVGANEFGSVRMPSSFTQTYEERLVAPMEV